MSVNYELVHVSVVMMGQYVCCVYWLQYGFLKYGLEHSLHDLY